MLTQIQIHIYIETLNVYYTEMVICKIKIIIKTYRDVKSINTYFIFYTVHSICILNKFHYLNDTDYSHSL